ncbi:Transcription factor, GATA [Artemisia annua]|uniref:Transcription factor, GATA n=1 Tax=Artemisia annua TaxID=35608 RepID=A0A2U1MT52_ARTAN|nr:Transcription factor, GATA [Artemisia annua]
MDCFTNEYYSKNDKHNHIMTNNNNNEFMLDDLIVDFPNEDDIVLNDAFFHNVVGHEGDLSNVSVGDSCNSSVSGSDQPPFSDVELCLPRLCSAVVSIETYGMCEQRPCSVIVSTETPLNQRLRFVEAYVSICDAP